LFKKRLPSQILSLRNLYVVSTNISSAIEKPFLLSNDGKMTIQYKPDLSDSIEFRFKKLTCTINRDHWNLVVMTLSYWKSEKERIPKTESEIANEIIISSLEEIYGID
jgi:hypothetical protein